MKPRTSKKDIFRIEWLAITLMALGIVLGIAGFFVKTFCASSVWTGLVSDLYPNITTDLLSIGFGILFIDRLYQRRNDEREKRALVSQMDSQFNILACDAARIIRDRGWHKKLDGISLWKANLEEAELHEYVLTKVNLTYANLKNANLNAANLEGATLNDANLEGARFHRTVLRKASIKVVEADRLILKDARFFEADLTNAEFLGIFSGVMTESPHLHLQAAYSLRGSIMPNGTRYDGRYNLQGDFLQAAYDRDIKNLSAMANFYGVSVGEYEQGQTRNVKYTKYRKTFVKKARALCKKEGMDWERMNSNIRGSFVDKFLPEP